jgi:hypothetical protein
MRGAMVYPGAMHQPIYTIQYTVNRYTQKATVLWRKAAHCHTKSNKFGDDIYSTVQYSTKYAYFT